MFEFSILHFAKDLCYCTKRLHHICAVFATGAFYSNRSIQIENSYDFNEATNKENTKSISSQTKYDLFIRSLTSRNADDAVLYKNLLFSRNEINANDMSKLMALLLSKSRLNEAKVCYEQLRTTQSLPLQYVLKDFLIKLALAGDIEAIENIGPQLSVNTKQCLIYGNFLCSAYARRDKVALFLEQLTDDIRFAETNSEIEEVMLRTPRAVLLEVLLKKPNLKPIVINLAAAFADKKQLGIMNILWQYYIIQHNDEESRQIFFKHFNYLKYVLFQHILRIAHKAKDDEMLRIAISQLRMNQNIRKDVIGQIFSSLIDIQLQMGCVSLVMDTLKSALEIAALQDLKPAVLNTLRRQVLIAGQKFPYTLPQNVAEA